MKKKILILMTIISCMFMCVSCTEKSSSHNGENNTGKLNENKNENNTNKSDEGKNEDNTGKSDENKNEVNNSENISTIKGTSGEMNQYIDVIREYFESKDEYHINNWLMITIPVIYYIDKTNESDIKVYGDFWQNHYTVYENQLREQAGGERPGICHIKKESNKYIVTSFEETIDGAYLEENILKYENEIDAVLNPTLYDLYINNDIKMEALLNTQNVILYQYTTENGLDNNSYKDNMQNIVKITLVKKVKYNGDIYVDTGEGLYDLNDENGDFKIEDVVEDINQCSEINATDFEKCTIKSNIGGNQIGVEIDGKWHIFEK